MYYPSAQALVIDFKNGAEFAISGLGRESDGPIKSLELSRSGKRVLVIARDNTRVIVTPNGEGFFKKEAKLRFVRFNAPQAPAPATAPAEPFLKRFVMGEAAYCPKTREVVEAVVFRQNALEVVLRNEDGITRVSTNYSHEGKHKWIAERSLVLGALPPKAKPDVNVPVYLFESRVQPGYFKVFTLNDSVDYSAWRQVGYAVVKAEGKQRG